MSRMIEHLDVEKRVVFIPQEVVEMVIRQEMPLVKAWRLFKDLSVQEVAESLIKYWNKTNRKKFY